MKKLEICVDNLTSALNAVAGGADRLEVCSALAVGGLTPSVGLVLTLKEITSVPLFCMIRPRSGNFVYLNDELLVMKADIVKFKEIGVDGFVFGVLDSDGHVDEVACLDLRAVADPLPCTFSRAIDVARDVLQSVQDIRRLEFKRILTSGQARFALEGRKVIRQMIEAAGEGLIIMPGSGINEANLEELLKHTNAQEIHASASIPVNSSLHSVPRCSNVQMGPLDSDEGLRVTSVEKVKFLVAVLRKLEAST